MKFKFTTYLVSIFTLVSCGGGTETNIDNLVQVQNISLENVRALAGIDDLIAVEYTDTTNSSSSTGYESKLNIYRQNPSAKNTLLSLGSIEIGVDTLYKRTTSLNVNAEWATTTLNQNFTDSGWASLVMLSLGAPYQNDLLLPVPGILSNAAATENWLVVYFDDTLAVYDINDLTNPILEATYPVRHLLTEFSCQESVCIIFSSAGYQVLDLTDGNNTKFNEVDSSDLAGVKRAYRDGNYLYVAGPSLIVGYTMIAKLNVAGPGNITIDAIKSDVRGEFVEYGFDRESKSKSHYVVTTSELLKYQLAENNFSEIDSSSVSTTLFSSAKRFHAHGERLYSGEPNFTIWSF